jgi:LuxR family quorum-sensing system transcriptional regulator SolR
MMKSWLEANQAEFSDTDSEQLLFAKIAATARKLGFEYCAYGLRTPVPISRPAVALFNNYSQEWQDCYREHRYIEVDPTVQHGLRSTSPIVWSEDVFGKAPGFWEDARFHGLQFGWAQAVRDANGVIGLLTLARGSEAITESELRANEQRMSWLTQFAHGMMSRVLSPKLLPELAVALTTRETEVLRWTAEGKTSYEIGRILHIAERTVNFHIKNIIDKLGVANKTQAAVKAGMLGLLI